jgi:hypothetical protein
MPKRSASRAASERDAADTMRIAELTKMATIRRFGDGVGEARSHS